MATDCWAGSQGNHSRSAETFSEVRSTTLKKTCRGMQRSVDAAPETVEGRRSVSVLPDHDQSTLHTLGGEEMDRETCPGKGQARKVSVTCCPAAMQEFG